MSGKNLLLISFLLANSFIYFYVIRAIISSNVTGPADYVTVVKGVFYAAIVVSSLLGVVLSRKLGRVGVLRLWLILGCVATAIPLLSLNLLVEYPYVIALLFGSSFGIGMPSCLAFFADLTRIEKRGLASGLTFVATNLGAVIFQFFSDNTISLTLGSLALRIIGLCALMALDFTPSQMQETQKASLFRSVLGNRTFLLYAIPWLVFCLVDRFERIYFGIFFSKDFFSLMSLAEPMIGTLLVIVAGFLADRIGRKRIVTFGFVALGVGYASVGLAPFFDVSRYFYTVVDGVAWGIFMVTYMLILWGDLSSVHGASESYYAIGSIPFFLSDLIALFIGQYITGLPPESAYAIFSLASFFLFVAVIPLIYAPETLPEKSMKDRELKDYLKKAKKAKEKYT